MIRVTSRRGVSLMLLIVAITVFAAVALGAVTLLRARHESYPYQVQSYQAYALAHAGVEFAIQYARDNAMEFAFNPGSLIPAPGSDPKKFSFGNGEFWLNYLPASSCAFGQMGTLTCRGVVGRGTATREVKITDFAFLARGNNSVVITSAPTRTSYTSGVLSGDEVSFGYCDPDLLGGQSSSVLKNTVVVASTTPVTLMRLGPSSDMSGGSHTNWVWDGQCGGEATCNKGVQISGWDGTSDPPPPNASYIPSWNCNGKYTDPGMDKWCRPQICNMDTTVDPGCDPIWHRYKATCDYWGVGVPSAVAIYQGVGAVFHMQFLGPVPVPTTFFVQFNHQKKDGSIVTNKFIFTMRS